MIHSALFGAWRVGKVLGWWEHQATWMILGKKKDSLLSRLEQEIQAREKPKAIPMTFVEVDPADAAPEPPKETQYYGAINSAAANPEPTPQETEKPKVDGEQNKVIRLADNPKPKPFPLQPALPPEEPAPPEPVKTEPKEWAPPKDLLNMGMSPPPKRERPRTLAAAKAQNPSLAGRKIKQDGGVRRRGRVSLNVKATPFGAYDLAFIRAVEQRWYDLLDSSVFVQKSGRVVLDFRLTSDGRIVDLKEQHNEVGEILGLLCQRAILDPAPYPPWPSDMRRAIGSNFREVTFTFYYN